MLSQIHYEACTFPPNTYNVFMKGLLETYTYLYGLTVVNKNHSANPLSCHTVLPIATIAQKNSWGCTPRVMEVELGGTNCCLIPAKVDLSPSPSKSWLSNPMLLSCFTSCPLISWKKLEASSVTTIPYSSVATSLSSIPELQSGSV